MTCVETRLCANGCGLEPHRAPIDCPVPSAMRTSADSRDNDGKPYLVRYGRDWFHRDNDRWADGLGPRVVAAIIADSERDPYSGELVARRELTIAGRIRAANEAACLVSWDGEHHYPENRQRLRVTDAALADKFLADKRRRWVEISGVAHGYIEYGPHHRFLPLLEEVADKTGIDARPYASVLVFFVHPDRETTLHIGSLSRRRDGGVTLEG